MFGAFGSRTGARPDVFGLSDPRPYYFLCVALAIGSLALVVQIRRSRLGRLLDGLADSPVALATHGSSINVTRVLVFCISSFLAGIAGALYVGVVGSVSSSGASPTAFVSFNSLLWLAVLAFLGRSAVLTPLLAAAALVIGPSVPDRPEHGAVPHHRLRARGAWWPSRVLRRHPAPASPTGSPGPRTACAARRPASEPGSVRWRSPMGDARGLQVDDLTVQFGGVVAVDGVTLPRPAGQITSLIGPNGAGKTTTFNACTGLLRPTTGRVHIDGTDVTGATPQRRAQLGLGRTFQRMELFDSLTVRENVALGREARLSGDRPWTHLTCSSRDRAVIAEATATALALCGIEALDGPTRPRPVHRPAPPGRAGPGDRWRVLAAAPRRAQLRARPRRDRGLRGDPPGAGRRPRHRDPARRARHEPRDVGERPPLRPRLRPPHLRGNVRRRPRPATTSATPTWGTDEPPGDERVGAGTAARRCCGTSTVTVPRGRVVALLGPNGAGKTTLLRTCSGLLPATRGQRHARRRRRHPVPARRRLSRLGPLPHPRGAGDLPAPHRGGEPPPHGLGRA